MAEIVQWEFMSVNLKSSEIPEGLSMYGHQGWQIASIIFPALKRGLSASTTPMGTIVMQRPLTEVRYPR